MQKLAILMLVAISISLTGCSSMRGNVVPKSGPTMEHVYDSMSEQGQGISGDTMNTSHQEDLTKIRSQVKVTAPNHATSMTGSLPAYAVNQEFHKLPNPELRMYIYPHLAGTDQVPIPGYFTAFNVYEHDHYALPQE